MTLKCVQGDPEGEVPIFVCHHCGKPVCEKHGLVVSADDAFSGPSTSVTPAAIDDAFNDSNRPGPRAAMHCTECATKYHQSAPKHSYWVDPKANQSRSAPPAGFGQPPRQDWDRATARP